MKKYRLKRKIKIIILLILIAIINIVAICQLFTVKTIGKTPVGDYECHGGIIKICGSSSEVANYLGV